MRTLSRVLLASSLTLLLLVPAPVWAWGNVGHEAVAYIAWKQMTPATKTRVLALLMQVPAIHTSKGDIPGYAEWVTQLPPGLSTAKKNEFLFMRAATWADSIKHAGLMDSDTPPPGLTEDVNVGFNDQFSHGYWHFIDQPFTNDGEALGPTPLPNVVTQINAFRTAIASAEPDLLKAYDMIFVEHLVGDIHQPLHASDRFHGGTGDVGGNDVRIRLSKSLKAKFICSPSKSSPSELHAFWDDLPGSCPAATGLAPAVAYASKLPLLLSGTMLPGAEGVSDIDPADWAKDSLNLAEQDVYAAPIGAGTKPDDGTAAYVITSAYYTQSAAVAKRQIALAGARLAKLLNENLK